MSEAALRRTVRAGFAASARTRRASVREARNKTRISPIYIEVRQMRHIGGQDRWRFTSERQVPKMHCDEAEILLHGLLDNETDTSAVRTHVAICSRCGARLQQFLALRELFRERDLHFPAPLALRRTLLARLSESTAKAAEWLKLLMGFGSGAAFSTLAAVFVMIAVIRSDQDAAITSDVLSAHLRSLDSTHVADVVTGDPKELQPWFSKRLGSEPPVPDLRSRGLDLVGGRIDFILGKAVAAIVYRRGDNLINVFVAQGGEGKRAPKIETLQGLNVALWSERHLKLCAVGDVSADELRDISRSFATSMSSAPI